jgi:hypothetical protein
MLFFSPDTNASYLELEVVDNEQIRVRRQLPALSLGRAISARHVQVIALPMIFLLDPIVRHTVRSRGVLESRSPLRCDLPI